MNTEEFKRIIPVLQPPMQRMAERMLGSKYEAKDLVQDLMVELWQHRHSLGKVDNLQGYAVRMTQFWCIDYLKAKPQLVPLSEMPDEAVSEPDEKEELFDELQRRIADLPKEDQQLLSMRYWEQIPGREMSRRLEISEGNVRVRLNRIIQKLRDGFPSGNKSKNNMKKTVLLLLLVLILAFGASAQQPHTWERNRIVDTTHHSLTLMLNDYVGNLTIPLKVTMVGIRYNYQPGNRWTVDGTVGLGRTYRFVEDTNSTIITYRDGTLIYQGPSVNIDPILHLYLGAGASLHLIDRSRGSRWDPYLGLSLGVNLFSKMETFYLGGDPVAIRSQRIHPSFESSFRLGCSYRVAEHWDAMAELDLRYSTPATLLFSKYCIGLTYKF